MKRWKPENGGKYWIVNGIANIQEIVWQDDTFDRGFYEIGNCFKTAAEAVAAAEKFKALLLSLYKPSTECSQLVTECNHLPDWCKVGALGYDCVPGYFKVIEIIDGDDNIKVRWLNAGKDGSVLRNGLEYKKEARLRPYNADEMKALVGKVITLPDGAVALCTAYSAQNNLVIIDNTSWKPYSLIALGYTIDGKPCGVLEHLENGEWKE